MSEHHSAPHIRLQVDQEVFVEQVRNGDVIEDATVATEVTSFDRVGDAYVLEGAIVFAGYMKREVERGASDKDATRDVSFEDEEVVEHIHHRMPFVLRVPVKSQPRGIVNVASRISSWNLEVMSAGWIRVLADLTVVGLNKNNGYHFECGAQEEGDLFFERPKGAKAVADAQENSGEPASTDFVPASDTEAHLEFARSAGNENETEEFDVPTYADAISESRGGNPLFQSVEPEPVVSPPEVSQPASREELAEFDRSFEGSLDAPWQPSEPASASDMRSAEAVVESEAFDDNTGTGAEETTKVEFEFVHQVESFDEEVRQDEASVQTPVRAIRDEESFVASRSFTDEGFKPTAAFTAPTITFNESPSTIEKQAVLEATSDVSLSDLETRSSSYERSINPLWSFVDFHAPESSYTLRFVVVMDEETLDGVADRVGCMKSDIIRVNRLSSEIVAPGQTLLVPTRSARAM